MNVKKYENKFNSKSQEIKKSFENKISNYSNELKDIKSNELKDIKEDQDLKPEEEQYEHKNKQVNILKTSSPIISFNEVINAKMHFSPS